MGHLPQLGQLQKTHRSRRRLRRTPHEFTQLAQSMNLFAADASAVPASTASRYCRLLFATYNHDVWRPQP